MKRRVSCQYRGQVTLVDRIEVHLGESPFMYQAKLGTGPAGAPGLPLIGPFQVVRDTGKGNIIIQSRAATDTAAPPQWSVRLGQGLPVSLRTPVLRYGRLNIIIYTTPSLAQARQISSSCCTCVGPFSFTVRHIAAILSSATLTVLLKKDEETMEDMRRRQGVDEYVQPSRPLSWAWAASSRKPRQQLRHASPPGSR